MIEIVQCLVQHLRADVAELMQANHRGCQARQGISPRNALVATGVLRQATLTFICALAVLCVHPGLLFLRLGDKMLDYTVILEL
jgi:hypothetical protein